MRAVIALALAMRTLSGAGPGAASPRNAVTAGSSAVVLSSRGDWHVEHDPGSIATIATANGDVALRFELAGGRPASQFAAAVIAAPPDLDRFGRLVIGGRADRPMRIAIQLRRRDDLGAGRWRRTMYLDREDRKVTFELHDFSPVVPERAPLAPLRTIAAVMLGVDTINTRPGTRAAIVLTDVRLER